jgi:hypothetical protein
MPRDGATSGAGLRPTPRDSTLDSIGKPRLQEAACAAPVFPFPPHPPLDPDQLATEFFETVVIEAEGELYPAIGDAALGDEAPEDLFQDPRKIHSFAPLAAAFVLVPGRSLPRA